MTGRPEVVIVEDEFLTQMHLQDMLEDFGYEVVGTAVTADGAVDVVDSERPRVVLMDVRLKGNGDGVDAALEIYRKHAIPVIFVTGSNEPETIERIRQDHASALLIKPVVPARLRMALEKALEAS